jgi:hypothetical protein
VNDIGSAIAEVAFTAVVVFYGLCALDFGVRALFP